MPITIPANHSAIDTYYANLDALKKGLNLSSEGSTRRAFSALLDGTSSVRKWTLAEEVTKRTKNHRIRLDGVLYGKGSLPRGYWEAKDESDDLNAEILKKKAKEYPVNNIIFEDTSRAVLIQDNVEVLDIDVRERDALANLLTRFYNYEMEPFEEFDKAVEWFSTVIPDIGRDLQDKIAESHKSNKKFQSEFAEFMELCKSSLNPNISKEAVDEMLIQHLLTERLIRNIFQSDFTQRNVIANKVEDVISALTKPLFDRSEFQQSLDTFYKVIENAAKSLANDYQEKQKFINNVYEQFFQGYSVKVADTHGIVYTPQEIVDFMCAAVEEVLHDEFGKKLGQEGVAVLDPATGTGNFIINLLNRVNPKYRREFYRKHLFANEVMLMPYYIASLNIEHEFYDLEGIYEPFEGISFVDTLDLAKKKQLSFDFMTEENSVRVKRQQETDITVIIGNPPYNVGQLDENDNNKNRSYEVIDGRVRETYVKDSKATNNNAVYDAYVKFFRWATDRLGDRDGVVCYVTNNNFVDGFTFDGMRKHLLEDFQRVYHLDLHGNVRQNPKLSGTTHNVFGIQVGVGITVAIRSSKHKDHKLFYHRVPEFWRKEQKLGFLTWNVKEDEVWNALNTVDWEELKPNTKNTWLISEFFDEFESFMPIGNKETKSAAISREHAAIFKTYSNGIKSNGDAYVYHFEQSVVINTAQKIVRDYSSKLALLELEGDKFVLDVDETIHKWVRKTKRYLHRKTKADFNERNIRISHYRPFCKMYHFFDAIFNEEVYRFPTFYPLNTTDNQTICLTAVGNTKDFHCLITNTLTDLHLTGDSQCFPYYVYDEVPTPSPSPQGKEGSTYNRRENITDWALAQFREQYEDESITKWDIFYYVYGLLHHPAYRERYADNLKRELPRIPFVPSSPHPKSLSQFASRERDFNAAEAQDSLRGEGTLMDEATDNSPSTFGREGQGVRANEGKKLLRPLGEGQGVKANEGDKIKQYVSKAMIQIARDLRQGQTPAEVILWEALRNRRLADAKFRRQHPIEGTAFVADFYCHAAKLVIELDGGIHEQQQEEDANRQAAIEELGYQVLRFQNEAVYENLEGVLEQIAFVVSPESPHPKSLSQFASQEKDLNDSENLLRPVGEGRDEGNVRADEGNSGFWAFSRAGKKLAEIHLNYEKSERYDGIEWVTTPDMKANYRVEKMRPKQKHKVKLAEIINDNPRPKSLSQFASQERDLNDSENLLRPVGEGRDEGNNLPFAPWEKGSGDEGKNDVEISVYDTLEYNAYLTLTGIPEKAFAYRLGNRSAIDWIVDQYRVKTDKRSGIVSDPNGYSDDEQYIVKLIERVVQVSVDTVDIVEELAKLPFREE